VTQRAALLAWRALTRDVDAILRTDWDPLGVADEAHAWNEYANYAPEIARLVWRGASVEDIAAHLRAIAVERMGLTADARHDARVAARLAKLRPRR